MVTHSNLATYKCDRCEAIVTHYANNDPPQKIACALKMCCGEMRLIEDDDLERMIFLRRLAAHRRRGHFHGSS